MGGGGTIAAAVALRQALAVAKIEKENAAVVARRIHPAAKRDGLPDLGLADFVAMDGAVGVRDHGLVWKNGAQSREKPMERNLGLRHMARGRRDRGWLD